MADNDGYFDDDEQREIDQDEKDQKTAIIAELTKLAIRRQAEVDIATLTIYAEDVFDYMLDWGTDLETVKSACGKIGLAPRKEYESVFPPIGNILAQIEALDAERQQQVHIAWCEKQKQKRLAVPVSKDDAADWLGKIKHAAHGVKVEPHD